MYRDTFKYLEFFVYISHPPFPISFFIASINVRAVLQKRLQKHTTCWCPSAYIPPLAPLTTSSP